ncbi:MAG: hypothetical protein P1U67_11145 [Alcanivoracaceae bacterium]|nr:hypothetical protein [Alcanivoracaceae bacterium]
MKKFILAVLLSSAASVATAGDSVAPGAMQSMSGSLFSYGPSVGNTNTGSTPIETSSGHGTVKVVSAEKVDSVTFKATMSLEGVVFPDYTANKDAYNTALKQTIASSMIGVSISGDIINLVIIEN